jgi:hypothetical protein
MFKAIGVAARRTDDGVEIVVKFMRDSDGRELHRRTFTAPTMLELRPLVRAELESLKASLDDAALNAAVVDQELDRI